jgi:hypothetical protein
MNDLTVLGEKYSAYYYVFSQHIGCPHRSGIPISPGVGWKMEVVFDDKLSCDISGLTGLGMDIYRTEPFNVIINVTDPENYQVALSGNPDKTYLKFMQDGSDISDSFIVMPLSSEVIIAAGQASITLTKVI